MKETKMNNNKLTCRNMLKDYFYDFVFNGNMIYEVFVVIIIVFSIYATFKEEEMNFLMAAPVFYVIFAGFRHKTSLPKMLYIVPCSYEWREEYIQKMLYIKILVPVVLALTCDVVVLAVGRLNFYNFILQMITIVVVAYIVGICTEGLSSASKKAIYGKISGYTEAITVAAILYCSGMLMILTMEISKIEFIVILTVVVVIGIPIINTLRKNWPQIRKNFANYELVTKLEVK